MDGPWDVSRRRRGCRADGPRSDGLVAHRYNWLDNEFNIEGPGTVDCLNGGGGGPSPRPEPRPGPQPSPRPGKYEPTYGPTKKPTDNDSQQPTKMPTDGYKPSAAPTKKPSKTKKPTPAPTGGSKSYKPTPSPTKNKKTPSPTKNGGGGYKPTRDPGVDETRFCGARGCGAAAAATWTFRGDGPRRRRGQVDRPWRRARGGPNATIT